MRTHGHAPTILLGKEVGGTVACPGGGVPRSMALPAHVMESHPFLADLLNGHEPGGARLRRAAPPEKEAGLDGVSPHRPRFMERTWVLGLADRPWLPVITDDPAGHAVAPEVLEPRAPALAPPIPTAPSRQIREFCVRYLPAVVFALMLVVAVLLWRHELGFGQFPVPGPAGISEPTDAR